MEQKYAYDHEKAYHFINMALVGEGQSLWEADDANADDVEDIFAIPRSYFDEIFEGAWEDSAQRLYDDLHGHIRDTYELVSPLRLGKDVIPDFDDPADELEDGSVTDIQSVWSLMQAYSKRINESIVNNVRYAFSQVLMGYVLRAKDDSHGVVVLRGTMNMQEWLNNLNYRLVPFDFLNADYGEIHNGFRDIYKGLRGQIREQVEAFDTDTPLYFVGHSLGAAVAQLAALDVVIRQPERSAEVQVYGFAPPRVGNNAYATAYNERIETSYRVINVCDVVPFLPSERVDAFMDLDLRKYADTKGARHYVHQVGNPVDNHVYSYHVATLRKVPTEQDFGTLG
ncbi:MAG: lipase family protein [Chloroflexota bacterium]